MDLKKGSFWSCPVSDSVLLVISLSYGEGINGSFSSAVIYTLLYINNFYCAFGIYVCIVLFFYQTMCP